MTLRMDAFDDIVVPRDLVANDEKCCPGVVGFEKVQDRACFRGRRVVYRKCYDAL
jgi:hypothetical protein